MSDPLRTPGMANPAWEAWKRACSRANVSLRRPDTRSRIMKTVDNSVGGVSAETHHTDGILNGEKYTVSVDISVQGLISVQVKTLLKYMAKEGFCPWYRYEGSFKNNLHIHAVYAGLPMKNVKEDQVVDYLKDRNGLANHGVYRFYTAPKEDDKVIAAMFLHANPEAVKKLRKP